MQSYNPTHIHEVFRQAVLAVDTARGAKSARRWAHAVEEYNREARVFRSVLTAPVPEGSFEPWTRAFKCDEASPPWRSCAQPRAACPNDGSWFHCARHENQLA